MDAIVGLGHFCETHGPCIILSTQRCKEEPKQSPHSLTVPWCESCQSINLDQSLMSKDNNICYVTTRTPLQQDLAFLLKQAAVRSLSCEETSKGGTMYFGDSERGHVFSHTFTLQDSLGRGFHRKYCILILMRDKIHLLNCWPILTRNIKEIATDLQRKSEAVNGAEQSQCSQRAVRQAQSSTGTSSRSLSQLIGEPAVFAQLHMWFTWLLSIEPVVEKSSNAPEIPTEVQSCGELRRLHHQMGELGFRQVCYCILTGIRVEFHVTGSCNTNSELATFKQLLPAKFNLPKSGEVCRCKLVNVDNNGNPSWAVDWPGSLPPKLPQLLTVVQNALLNNSETMPDNVLKPFLTAEIVKWFNIARVLCWVAVPNQGLLQSLGVQKCDLPLLAYWTAECRSIFEQ